MGVVVLVGLGVLLITWMYTLVEELRRVGTRPGEVLELLEKLVRDVLLLFRRDHDGLVGADPSEDL